MTPFARSIAIMSLALSTLLLSGCWEILPYVRVTVTNSSAYPLEMHYDSTRLDVFQDEVLRPVVEDLGPGQSRSLDIHYDDYDRSHLEVTGPGFDQHYDDLDDGSAVQITQLQLSRNG
jgi:hypothetical protein